MYLSKISFSPSHLKETVRHLRSSLYREHQMIWNLFENDADQQRDFIYRREETRGQLPFFYLMSKRKPLELNMALDIETKAFNPVLTAGEHLSFCLRANAVVTRKVSDQSNKRKRRDIIEAKVDEYKTQYPKKDERPEPSFIHHAAAQEWLNKQGERHGFKVDNFLVENHQYYKVSKPGDDNKRQFTSLDFHGQLEITEKDQFISALFQGFGRSKAFGCGLMLIRRL